MAVNRDKPDNWKSDIIASVDMYNKWFMEFAPKTFREAREQTAKDVEDALQKTSNMSDIQLRKYPGNPVNASYVDLSAACG